MDVSGVKKYGKGIFWCEKWKSAIVDGIRAIMERKLVYSMEFHVNFENLNSIFTTNDLLRRFKDF